MSDLENSDSIFDISVKLCYAIEKHQCLYDRNSVRKIASPECERAWEVVAKECNQTVEYSKNRWKNLLRAFYQGLKRRGNPYYLHDYMTFLLEGKGKKKTKRPEPEALLNDETNSTTTHDEIVNVEDEAAEESDSNTNSADESIDQIEGDIRQENGVFTIYEIGETADEGEISERRLSYKRSCKRGLDPELLDELGDENSKEPEGKRTRRAREHNDLEMSTNKKVLVRLDKINKSIKDNMDPVCAEKIWPKKTADAAVSAERIWPKKTADAAVSACIETKISTPKAIEMIDSSTCTTVDTRCIGTQYESTIDTLDYDEIFMQSLKQRLQEMNARQKMNFKAKIYQSLLEVFDDTADFPGANEIFKLPPKKSRVFNTTTGELRLMRELVSLVQAAKNTPEIVNAKEKVKTTASHAPDVAPVPAPAVRKTPIKLPVANSTDHSSKAQSSPLSLSDDDDFQFSLDNLDDDDDDLDLPRTWEEIKGKPSEPAKTAAATTVDENVMGLPRHILQKVVKVSGSSGSTIVARDGDKKRIYRIYPKSLNPNGGISPVVANKNTNMGTFYVTPPNGPGETVATANVNKNPINKSSITVRSFNTTGNNKTSAVTSNNDATKTSANNSNQSFANNSSNQTAFKNIHPANRILSATTGLFKMVSTPKPITNPSNQKPTNAPTITNFPSSTVTKVSAVARNPMLPPSSANHVAKRQVVRSHVNTPQLMQRRYSICGPLPADKQQHSLPTLANSPITSKGINAPRSQPQSTTSVSQIQISQPISLNTTAAPNAPTTSTQSNHPKLPTKTETNFSAPVADIKISIKEPQPNAVTTTSANNSKTPAMPSEEIPILETAGTVGVDVLDPLFVKTPHIKSEPSDD